MPCSPRVISTPSHRARSRNTPRRRGRVLVGPDAQVRRDLRLVVVRRDERRAGVVVDVRDLRIDQDRDRPGACALGDARPRAPGSPRPSDSPRHDDLRVVEPRAACAISVALDVAVGLGVGLVVDARHLLVARGDDALLGRRRARRIDDEPVAADPVRGELGPQPCPRRRRGRRGRRGRRARRAPARCARRWRRRRCGTRRDRARRPAPAPPARSG